MGIDFSLAQGPGNFTQALLGGYQAGRQMGRQKRTDAVLGGFQADPEGSIAQAYAFDPELGDHLSQRRARTLYSDALVNKQAPSAEIARLDPDLWKKLDDQQKAQVKQSTEFLSNAAFDIGNRPEAERAAVWSSYVKQAEANGMDIPVELETYSEAALRTIVARAGQTAEWIKASEPKYLAVPKDADLVNLRDPAAIRQFQTEAATGMPQAAPDLPPGFVIDGGPTPPASGGFR